MAEAPKCKLCGHKHWFNQEHTYPDETPQRFTQEAETPQRFKAPRVTPQRFIASEAEMIDAAVHEEHECPICGLTHKRPQSSSERVAAYRQRQKHA